MTKTWQDYGREWLDTLVVAISVAMAFRAYLFEPFNIPTGSMMPTLYGNHSEPCRDPGVFETTPLKWLNWAVSGRDYKELVAPCEGTLVLMDRGDGRYDCCIQPLGGAQPSKPVSLPTDFVLSMNLADLAPGRAIVPGRIDGARQVVCSVDAGGKLSPLVIPKGRVVWKGYDTTGDFIFVNRWRWNFRRPARGEVMVFATTGIDRLVQGTHYIKRLTALPGETVEIVSPDVFIDGRKLDAPLKPMIGERGEKTPEPNPGAAGGMTGPRTMGADEYFACGDNSDNSFDSRYWGPVPRENLKGVGSLVFWPIVNPRWGLIP